MHPPTADRLQISQKRYPTQTTFVFGDDELTYSIQDGSGRHTFSVPYDAIPTDVDELIERNAWFRNAGIFWMCLGLLQIGMRWQQGDGLHGSMWMTLGVVCVVVYAFRKTSYSIITTERGRMFIIRDRSHDDVMTQIVQRRKQRLRQQYATVDLGNDPERELRKFAWLKEASVISGAEYLLAVAQLRDHHSPTSAVAPRTAPAPRLH